MVLYYVRFYLTLTLKFFNILKNTAVYNKKNKKNLIKLKIKLKKTIKLKKIEKFNKI